MMLEIYTENMTAQVTKKPAGLAPCGLSGLHRMTLVITDGEFWWSWRSLNNSRNYLNLNYFNVFNFHLCA